MCTDPAFHTHTQQKHPPASRSAAPPTPASHTLDGLREAVTTLEETERIARRVLGGAHPTTSAIDGSMQAARAALRARETPPTDAREDGDLDEVEDA